MGYFFVAGPLGGLKHSQGTFSDTLIPLEAFKRIFFLRPKGIFVLSSKIDFFPRGRFRGFLVKNEPTLKFDHYCEV